MWYLVFSRATGREESRLQHHEEHVEWLLAQHRAGRVLFSGPNADRSCGIYILLASSHGDAERLAAEDPHHVYGDRVMEVTDWEPRRAFQLDGPTIADVEKMAKGVK